MVKTILNFLHSHHALAGPARLDADADAASGPPPRPAAHGRKQAAPPRLGDEGSPAALLAQDAWLA